MEGTVRTRSPETLSLRLRRSLSGTREEPPRQTQSARHPFVSQGFESLSHTERYAATNAHYQLLSENVSLGDTAAALPIASNLGLIGYRVFESSPSAKTPSGDTLSVRAAARKSPGIPPFLTAGCSPRLARMNAKTLSEARLSP